MIRTVVVVLLIAIGCYQWIAAYAVVLARAAWRDLAMLVVDPGRLSPVAVGGALIVLCAAVLFRHITAWVLTYAALISIPAAAFVGAVAITASSNFAGRAGVGALQSPPAERRVPQPADMAPPHRP